LHNLESALKFVQLPYCTRPKLTSTHPDGQENTLFGSKWNK